MYVGKDVPHDSARGHVTGESMYIDEFPPMPGELIVDFVWSPLAHARIRGISIPTEYKDKVFTAADLTGVKPIRAVTTLRGRLQLGLGGWAPPDVHAR